MNKIFIKTKHPVCSAKNPVIASVAKQSRAFTFVEVIIALTIVSISLLGLIKLHITNISMTESAEITGQAVLLAQDKIAQVSQDYPIEGNSQGTIQKNALTFNWQTDVTDLQLPLYNGAKIEGLRKISVDINWQQGIAKKHLQMSTYIADRKLQ